MKIKIGLMTLLCSLILTGCEVANTSNDQNNNEPLKNEKPQNETESNTGSNNNEEVNTNNEEDNKNESKEENITLKIYTSTPEDEEKMIEYSEIEMSNKLSLEDKLNKLCKALQTDYFKDENAQIVLESINEDKIATINLKNQRAWNSHFAGSTGGMISSNTIIETLLQKEFEGEWIRGVKILVDGKDEEVFDHAPFIETFMR